MATYTLEMDEECGGSETLTIQADDPDGAIEIAEETVADWVRGGDYGADGALVRAYYTLRDEDNEPIADRVGIDVAIEPDHAALIRAAGGDPECDHDWTGEGEGGCDENPGVWSSGGTVLRIADRCRTCGLHRLQTLLGPQRNPGEHDTVEYSQPETWCPECGAEDCRCEPDSED